MEPITREEYYLAKIAGTYEGKTPKPVTNDEYYLATMAGDYSGNTPQPVTRLQYYMAKVAGVWGGSIPAPVTRLEYYWAAIASGEGKVFPPVTREEHFLVLVADAYSVVLTVVTGNPALLENSKGNRGLESLTLYGKSTQGSTTGAQLLPFEVGEKREGFEVFKDGIAISDARKKDIYAVGRDGMTNESSYDDFPLLASGEYYVYSDSASVNLIVVAFRNGKNITLGSSMKGVAAKIKVMDGDKFRIFLRIEEAFNGKVKAMISKTQPTASNYEPYTGGAPSPSPSYPQEIENAGQSGEIGVDVYGGNLIKAPFESRENSYKPGYTFTQNGITFTVQNDMGIKVAGTNTSADKVAQFSVYYQGVDEKPKYPAGTYTFSEWATVQIELASEVINKNGTFTANEEFNVNGFYIAIPAGQSVNKTIYPMLNIGSTALPYEPYKPAQTLIIPTPNGLPGIPVSSGGNYTDEKGQQWVADEIDLANGEMVQRIGKTVVDGEKVKFVASSNSVYWNLPLKTSPGIISGSPCTSRYFADGKFWANNSYDFVWTTPGKMKPYFDTSEELNAFCVQKNSEGNPLTIYYCIETLIRTPLSPETIAAYKALRTYSPTTTVINDAGAGMSVGYKKAK